MSTHIAKIQMLLNIPGFDKLVRRKQMIPHRSKHLWRTLGAEVEVNGVWKPAETQYNPVWRLGDIFEVCSDIYWPEDHNDPGFLNGPL